MYYNIIGGFVRSLCAENCGYHIYITDVVILYCTTDLTYIPFGTHYYFVHLNDVACNTILSRACVIDTFENTLSVVRLFSALVVLLTTVLCALG